MANDLICFTVSMWNRFQHLKILIKDLSKVMEQDEDIALYVCAFKGKDAVREDVAGALGDAPFPTELVWREDEFGNGLGHNLAAKEAPEDCIISIVTVDINLPPDITSRIRPRVVRGKEFYFPEMFQQCRDGRLEKRGGGGALLAIYRDDLLRLGGLQPARCPWGGNTKLNKAEDCIFPRKAQEAGLKMNRPVERDMFCKWHKRFRSNPFYRTLRGRQTQKLCPWMNFYRDNGLEIRGKL